MGLFTPVGVSARFGHGNLDGGIDERHSLVVQKPIQPDNYRCLLCSTGYHGGDEKSGAVLLSGAHAHRCTKPRQDVRYRAQRQYMRPLCIGGPSNA